MATQDTAIVRIQVVLTRTVIPMAAGAALFFPFGLGTRRDAVFGGIAIASVAVAFVYLYTPGLQGMFAMSQNKTVYLIWRVFLSNAGSPIWNLLAGAVAEAGIMALASRQS
jgi:hypothetical protein